MPIWDVLCNIETRKISVHKDIGSAPPPPSLFPTPPPIIPRSGTVRSDGSGYDEDTGIGRAPSQKESKEPGGRDFVAKSDNPDNLFMEDVSHVQFTAALRNVNVAPLFADLGSHFLPFWGITCAHTVHRIFNTVHSDGRSL